MHLDFPANYFTVFVSLVLLLLFLRGFSCLISRFFVFLKHQIIEGCKPLVFLLIMPNFWNYSVFSLVLLAKQHLKAVFLFLMLYLAKISFPQKKKKKSTCREFGRYSCNFKYWIKKTEDLIPWGICSPRCNTMSTCFQCPVTFSDHIRLCNRAIISEPS